MDRNERIAIVEQETKNLFEKLGAPGQIQAEETDDGVTARVQLEQPQIFIGDRGQTLLEIQHLLKLILRKKTGESFPFSLDINNYRVNKEHYLRELANTVADEVILLKKHKELPPMPSSERRIIHMELADRQDVVSESVGEEEERRVVVRVRDRSEAKASTGPEPEAL